MFTSEGSMKAYVLTTGIVFALIFVGHAWEVIDRHHLLIGDVIVFGASAGLAMWAWRLARRPA